MDKNKKTTGFKLFLKSAFLTALCIILVLIGFFGAAFFSGRFG